MARFQFRLSALLAVREATRDERRVQLVETQAEHCALKERLAAMERELAKQQDSFRATTSPGRLDVERLVTAHRYEVAIRRELHILAEQQQALSAEIEFRREALIEADREVRILEKLRERQHEQFRQRQMLAETKLLDEIAANVKRREED